jgi:hypothetical protein
LTVLAEDPTDNAAGARHCWVSGPPGDPGRWPGLLAEWARRDGGWFGRVVYAVDDGGRVVLAEAWVPAEHLEPTARYDPCAGHKRAAA